MVVSRAAAVAPPASTAAHTAIDAAAGAPAAAPVAQPPAAAHPPTLAHPAAAAHATAVGPALGEFRLDVARGRYVASLGSGRAVLTLDPRLQARLERTLQGAAVPWGVTVLLEPATGRILAMAEHSQAEPGRRGLALTAFAPAASIFKIVTTAALLEQGVRPDNEVCYHGGKRRLQPALLSDDPRRDRSCTTVERAFGHSTNVVFAKLAYRGLDAALLRAEAKRFLFNEASRSPARWTCRGPTSPTPGSSSRTPPRGSARSGSPRCTARSSRRSSRTAASSCRR